VYWSKAQKKTCTLRKKKWHAESWLSRTNKPTNSYLQKGGGLPPLQKKGKVSCPQKKELWEKENTVCKERKKPTSGSFV